MIDIENHFFRIDNLDHFNINLVQYDLDEEKENKN